MSKQRRSYNTEFKLEALQLFETSGKTAAEIEREPGIRDGCLLQRKREPEAKGIQAFPGHGRLPASQEELLRVRRELANVRQERNIQKCSGHGLAPKIPVAKVGGGYIYHSDHSVSDDVSFAQHCRVLKLVKQYGQC